MKLTHLLLLAVILGALVTAVVLKNNRPHPEITRDIYEEILPVIHPETVQKVEIGRAGKTAVTLTREDAQSGWAVMEQDNAPADEERVQRLVAALSGSQGLVRSEKAALLKDYKITDSEAFEITVTGKDGAVIADLLAGAKKPSDTAVFVRRSGEQKVLVLEKALFSLMGAEEDALLRLPAPSFWIKKDVFRPLGGTINGFEINPPKGQTVTLKKADQWVFEKPETAFAVDESRAGAFIQAVLRVSAQQVVASMPAHVKEDTWKFELLFEEDAKTDFEIKADTDEAGQTRYFLRKSGEPWTYEIATSFARSLMVGPRYFMKDNPFQFDEASIENILLVYGDRQIFVGQTEDRSTALDKISETLAGLDLNVEALEDSKDWPEVPEYGMEINTSDGNKWVLGFRKAKDADGYDLRVSDKDGLFRVSPETFKALFLPFFLKTPAPETAPAA